MNRSIVLLSIAADSIEIKAIRARARELSLSYDCHFVHDASQAFDFLERRAPFTHAQRPDLILLSAHPSGNRASQILRAIKSDGDYCAIPMIVISSGQQLRDQDTSELQISTTDMSDTHGLEISLQLLAQIDRFWASPF